MPPNLKFVVAQCYRGWRSIGSRQFCSRAQSDGGNLVRNRPDSPLVPKKSIEVVFGPWVLAGYTTYFGWEMFCLHQIEQKMDSDTEFESKRSKEMVARLREHGISID